MTRARLLLAAIALTPGLAAANTGVPMLALTWPAQWIVLLPIILLEGKVAHQRLFLPLPRALKVSLVANLVSTLIGVPVAWAAMLVLEVAVINLGLFSWLNDPEIHRVTYYALFLFMAAWIFPEPLSSIWVAYPAFVILAVPFCFVSIVVESWVARRMLPESDPTTIRSWAKRANIMSYIFLLAVVGLCLLVFSAKAT